MTRQEFFRPFVKAKPWEIVLCIAIGCIAIFYAQYCIAIFYAQYAPSIWAALLVFLLWYCFVFFVFLLIKHLSKK